MNDTTPCDNDSIPYISVIIPVYNCASYIKEAIDSVLRQQYSQLEILVVDDGSTDGTLKVLKEYGDQIVIIEQENKGPSSARNAGIKRAKGEIIGFVDSDDMWTSNHLEVLLPLLQNDPACMLARGYVEFVRFRDNQSKEIVERTEGLFMEALVGACLYRADTFKVVGLFDETMRSGEDFDWNIRFSESGLPQTIIKDIVLSYRRHENNMTNSKECMAGGQFGAFRRKLERARSRVSSVSSSDTDKHVYTT
ncbi:MAG: glycosyltransferase family 2 protein [Candidatus Pacebacteria bacterium]|nr:glycosyltransferase family 2 protein [Candidatus Paceibacterota bacterium]